MRLFHLIFGALLFAVFVLTGQYMDRYYDHLRGMADGPRMLMRSRHIYIFLAAMLNLGLGAYFTPRPHLWRRLLQLAGSGLIVVASGLFVAAFFYEPGFTSFYTPYSRRALYLILWGTSLHVFGGLGRGERRRLSEAGSADAFRASRARGV
jgi:hypothetical protein